MLANTSNQVVEFCKNFTRATSAAVDDLYKTRRPTTILVERATSISERHLINSGRTSDENSDDRTYTSVDQIRTSEDRTRVSEDRTRTSGNRTRTIDMISDNCAVSSSVRQKAGYSSDEFDSYER